MSWSIQFDSLPQDWEAALRAHEAGFFATSESLAFSCVGAAPVYCRLFQDGRPVGLALGGRRRCSLSPRAQHFIFGSPPVLANGIDRSTAMRILSASLEGLGAAEVAFGSFDAPSGCALPQGTPGTPRLEYRVRLEDIGDSIRAFSTSQRRHIRRGEDEGWTLSAVDDGDASRVLSDVQKNANGRAMRKGATIPADQQTFPALTSSELSALHGLRVFSATGPNGLLAAVLIGWCSGRAYYLAGGSTAYGYGQSAAAWLHWAVMDRLRQHGFKTYNLGGTPASACNPEDAAHGLYRFKTGFGAEIVSCRGATEYLRPIHNRAHALLRRVRTWIQQETNQ